MVENNALSHISLTDYLQKGVGDIFKFEIFKQEKNIIECEILLTSMIFILLA